ncbi:MAG TPA: hypothetical protein VNI01_05940 [Elusimicrobiota bacterium]|jgi:hypothetical protein|nr:hypothetical protein [Elusimicrobiota bacterium]
MLPAGRPRWTLRELPSGVRVDVAARRRWPVLALLGAWLCACIAGDAAGLWSLRRPAFASAARQAPLLILAGAWNAAGLLGGAVFLWLLGGRESLEIAHGWVRVKLHVFGVGKSWEWDHSRVRAIEVARPRPGRGLAGMLAGAVEIRHDEGRRSFGMALTAEDARVLLHELRTRCVLPSAK